MTSPISGASPGQGARDLLKSFQEKYPVFQEFKPLAIGIDRQLLAGEAGLDRKALRLALGMHTHSFRYLKAMEKAAQRFNLDGSPGGEVPEEHRRHAADILRERARKEAERRKAESEEQEARAAERQRAEKLSQLVQKFAKQTPAGQRGDR
ncbi:MAG: ProQ/FinO family protein [Candidatus Accumulibacter sp.]|jgi:ProP effector|nr:ProQ/FinO family protein [Accumulibacter sp.]